MRERWSILRVILVCLATVSSLTGAEKEAKDWAYRKPAPIATPAVDGDRGWVRNGIDAFILAKLRQQGLAPAEEASPTTLIRRVHFDLIGLPPTPDDVDAFLADRSPAAYDRVVDRLLNDPRFGERWARLWLDVARYADTAGYEGDPDLPHAWRYRDYVIDAFNHDKPYDLFVKEQIAGDEFAEIMGAGDLPAAEPERVVALTFLRLAPFTEPRGDETRHELLSEMTSIVGSTFLGLTVGCAKCHDHKYDEIPTEDFYRMKAFFATVQIPRPEPGDVFQIGGPVPADFHRTGEKEWAENLKRKFTGEIEESKRALVRHTAALQEKLGSEGAGVDIGKHLDRLTKEQREQYLYLAERERFLRQQLKRLLPQAMSLRHSYGPPYEPGVPTSRVMIRGEWNNPGKVVEPGFPSCITGHQEPTPIRLDPFKRWPMRSRRMALAEWIASPENPLTARVMVNRLWHWHFGRGIVATPSDFGKLGGGPSHPELLDWLANRFVAADWNLKSVHRMIVTSSAYRQTSRRSDDLARKVDPENRLLWRFRRRRLEAEAIRDGVLAVSGRLETEQCGLPIYPPLSGNISETVKYSSSKWDTQRGPEGRRRSIYIYQQRTLTMPLMQVFDSLVCEESRPRRRTSVTPLQALALYNGDFVNEEARHFSRRVRTQAGDDPAAHVRHAFHLALGRTPTPEEATRMEEFLRTGSTPEESLAGLCRVLFNSNEFVYVD